MASLRTRAPFDDSGGSYRVVGPDEIECFLSEDGVTYLLTEGERLVVTLTIDELERRLEPDQFFRISRAALVRVDRVVEVAPEGGLGWRASDPVCACA